MQEEKEGVLLIDSWTIIEFIHKSLINCGRAANERDLKIASLGSLLSLSINNQIIQAS